MDQRHRAELLAAQADVICVMKRLEAATGRKVKSLEIARTDITGMYDEAVRHARHVVIELEPLYNDTWGG
ncbi:MAG: hypothetical protein ABI605_10985 [Rhizobacter sp.]